MGIRTAVKVVLRTRPTTKFADDQIKIQPDKQHIVLNVKRKDGMGVINHQNESFQFSFDRVMHNCNQESMFEVAGLDMVESVLDGYNGTILAYGQTGAGKTFTMTGGKHTEASFNQRGLVPRVVSSLYNKIKSRTHQAVTVRVSYAEIYNESFYDLLDPSTAPTDMQVMEDKGGGVHVKGLSYLVAPTEEDALSMLFEGEANRAVAEHQLNKSSSRSHSIFTISLESSSRGSNEEQVLVSKLHLVDLAGSERLSKTKSEGQVAKEAQYINKSLSFLEQVIVALGNKARDHIPYRSSKLTHMLKDSLGGNCKTLMIANVWGEAAQVDETLSTCKFAQRMQRVSNEATVNYKQDNDVLVRKYEKEIRELKQELAMHDSFSAQGIKSYDPYTKVQRADLRAQVLQFLEHDGGPGDESLDPLELSSLRHMREILLQTRVLYLNLRAQGPAPAPGRAARKLELGPDAAAGEAGEEGEMVGDAEEGEFEGIPAAPDHLRPPAPAAPLGPLEEPPSPSSSVASIPVAGPPAPARADAFEDWKKGPGKGPAGVLGENKASLKERKKRSKELAVSINTAKQTMDEIRVKLDEIREGAAGTQGGGEGGEGKENAREVGKEEAALLVRMRDEKKVYKDAYEELKMIKSEMEYTSRLVDECTKNLVAEFDKWYSATFPDSGSGRPAAAPTAVSPSPPACWPQAGKLASAVSVSPHFDDRTLDDDDDASVQSYSTRPPPGSNEAAFVQAQKSVKRGTAKFGAPASQRPRPAYK